MDWVSPIGVISDESLEEMFRPVSTSSTFPQRLLAFFRINKPGGCAKITKVHYATDGLHVESIDVKYVLGGGFEKEIDPAIVSPYESLKREGRKRRGRDFLMDRADEVLKKVKQAMSQKKTAGATKRNSGAAAANRTPAQPDHSTSPSTPVTPDHPSAKKAAKASQKPLVTNTTVPSFVIADSTSVEVSPLQDPINRATDVPTKSTIARRGLFGVSKKKQEKSNPAKASQKKLTTVYAAEDTSTGMSSSASSPLAPQTSQEVQRAHSAAVKQTLSKKQNKFMTKHAPLTDHNEAAVARGSHKTSSLQNVFDQELRKAREFLDEVCRAPHKDLKDEVVDPTPKESRLDTSGSEADEPDRKPSA